ncbi:pyridoxamine 5'-phosphate oxidase family protein [Bacillus carboniphilus]|uniref:Pyridoxamine 5'-phosphate oxidase family protein n=1 Tax=Bacillus carboniphilus TaxID=86663 RepID=A0ABY9JVP4_9BACI|nr:pyridoxamine 5'-phosphate oxidase family protein [Bacillus carboniphilus]WLR42527.1 pyridoxamine 5'-phosphate oxidase family protein [Bacillus carboniphilus]
MSDQQLKEQILSVFNGHNIGVLSTVQNNKPYSRFMMFFHEDMTLFCATNKEAHKTEQIEANPHVHILLGYEGKKWNDEYAEIEGTCSIETSAKLKEHFWNDHLKEWIQSADDPDYVLLKITPKKIRYFKGAGTLVGTLTC